MLNNIIKRNKFSKKYKPAYKSKDKIPKKYFEGLNKHENQLMTKEILKRPQSLKYWTADKAYSKRLKKEGKNLPKSNYTIIFHNKYGKENAGSLEKISKITGIKLSILKEVYKRGIGAWQGSHRPGVYPSQWAKTRVFSFVLGGKTTKQADKDLWEKIQKNKIKKRKNPITEGSLRRWLFFNINKYVIVVPNKEDFIFPTPSPYINSIDSEKLILDLSKNKEFKIDSVSKLNIVLKILHSKVQPYIKLWELIFNSEKTENEKNKLWKLYMVYEPVIPGY